MIGNVAIIISILVNYALMTVMLANEMHPLIVVVTVVLVSMGIGGIGFIIEKILAK
jgi:hypothetical protein